MDGLLTFAELDKGDGSPPRKITFEGCSPVPLGYEALKGAKSTAPLTIRCDWRNARVVETNIPDFDLSQPHDLAATVESKFTAYAIGLVRGGWLPPSLVDTDAMVLLDRNIISEIVSRFSAGALKGRDPDFIDLFRNSRVRLHPMMAILEGAEQRLPSEIHAKAQFEEIIHQLKTALPNAEILASPGHLSGALGWIEATRNQFDSHVTFLLRVAPTMSAPVGRNRKAAVWTEILLAASDCGVPRTSVGLLAVLSALAAPNGTGPARGILKFKAGYSAKDAYNAWADLRALEMFLVLLSLHPELSAQLCTADRNLALFWVGMGAHSFRWSEDGVEVDFSFHEDVLPGWAAAWWRTPGSPSEPQ